MAKTEIFFADGDNPKMIEAYQKAQQTFKYFWRELSWEYRRIIPALNVACVKIAFSQDIDNEKVVEHMWINDIEFDGTVIFGTLINSPGQLTNVNNGEFVEVGLNQISDWLFATASSKPKKGLSKMFSKEEKPTTYGGFTIQVIRSEMSPKELKEHDKAWGLNFGDYNEILLDYEQKENPENLIEHPMSKNMKDKLIEFLKENPEEIETADENGLTLLHRETIAGNLSSVEVILAKGANKNSKTKLGLTALDFAEKLKWETLIDVLKD